MDTLKLIGSRIRELRKEQGLSIGDLAESISVAYGTLANIESGTKKPTIEQLQRIGEILGYNWIGFLESVNSKGALIEDDELVQEMVRENVRSENQRKENIKDYIEKAICLAQIEYSPTGSLLSGNDVQDIRKIVNQMIIMRIEQIQEDKKRGVK